MEELKRLKKDFTQLRDDMLAEAAKAYDRKDGVSQGLFIAKANSWDTAVNLVDFQICLAKVRGAQ